MDLDELQRLLREATLPPKVLEEDGRYVRQQVGIALTPAEAALWYALRNCAEELIRDARRYRWLADKVMASDYGDNDRGVVSWNIRHHKGPHWIDGDSIDAAIDAAIAQEQP